MIGRTVSHYTVLEKLGAGGMGEIYKAQDTRLNRFVAMKVLSTSNAGDVERRRRFVQEAQAASALNHPNIITIHDVVSADGLEFMVMEFVSGVTLDDMIPQHGLNVQKTLDIAVQIADALQTAHAAGIVHRDLKPANAMVTGTGLVKILDFGIAKLTGPTPAAAGNTDETLPIDSPMTVEGSILGTVCYMSPEQAQAKAVDPRSDIFSFGLVLYEMLTGKKAFSGDSALSTLSAILRDEAKPIGEIVQGVPPELDQIVYRAMRKSPDERWQTMQEMRAALLLLKQKADSGVLHTQLNATAVVAPKKKSIPLAAILAVPAVLVLAAGGGGAWWWMKHRAAQNPPPAAVQVAPTPAPVEAQPAPEAATAPAPEEAGMSNQDVLGLVGAKVPQVTIVGQIRAAAKTNFDLSTNGIIELTKGGVSPQIIEVMRNPKAAAAAPVSMTHPTTTAPPVTRQQPAAPPPVTPAPVTSPVNPPPAVQSAPVVAPPPTPIHINTVSVPDGKPFNITLAQDVPVKLTAGEKVAFTITNDVKVGDIVVIPKGAAVAAQVMEPGDSKKVFGILGKSKATFKLIAVESAGGGKLNIRATPAHSDKPEHPIEVQGNKTKDVIGHAGTEYMGYIDGDQTVTIKH
ncbi:MAG TPA: serine/threonine-protein kinase [Bryobacteraceae bacterium]|jgi:serine/threonine-protein kinase|nr:serine/threonine-protein kinase [Bryobacteraceae bacterium]